MNFNISCKSGNINTCYDTEILGAMLFKFEPGVLFHLYCLFVVPPGNLLFLWRRYHYTAKGMKIQAPLSSKGTLAYHIYYDMVHPVLRSSSLRTYDIHIFINSLAVELSLPALTTKVYHLTPNFLHARRKLHRQSLFY